MGIFSKRRSPASMKRLYNWFFKYYHFIERSIDPKVDEVLDKKVRILPGISQLTATDFACGSGMLTLKLATLFRKVTGIDQSEGMLRRARQRATEMNLDVAFTEGSVLDIQLPDKSTDWAFSSFALHLFSPETEIEILRKLLAVSTRGVMVIDHSRKRTWPIALVERIEGSFYDQFIKTDFEEIARIIGAASFEEDEIADCMVLTFYKCN